MLNEGSDTRQQTLPPRKRPSATSRVLSGGKQPRISRAAGALMITAAVFIDGMQFLLTFLPIVGWIFSMLLSVCAVLLFGIWFFHYGVNLFSISRGTATIGTLLAEITPIIGGLPWWTIRISAAVVREWSRKGTV